MRTVLVLSLMLIVAGCTPTLTLHPLWDKEHLASEPALEGRWISAEGDCILQVSAKSKDAEYLLDFGCDDGLSHYKGRLVRLNGHLILDLSQDDIEKMVEGQAFPPILPVHFFALVRIEGDKLVIGLLPEDDMEKQIQSDNVKLQWSRTDGGAVVTSSTAEVQEAVGKLAGNPEIWEESTFYRASVLPKEKAK